MFYREFLSEQMMQDEEDYPPEEETEDPTSEEDSEDEEELDPDATEEEGLEEEGLEEKGLEEEPDPEAFLEPLKKYFLIQKIQVLKQKVDNQGIGFSELDDLIFFLNDLDYNSILIMTSKIIDMIMIKIKEVKNGKIKTN